MPATLTDARRHLSDALRTRVHGRADWQEPSLDIFRNHLLDDVGSDARPFVNLLMEAHARGITDALPETPMHAAGWHALSSKLVMAWVADRFVQPEVARWAVEAWAYARGTITAEQRTMVTRAPDSGSLDAAVSTWHAGHAAPAPSASAVARPAVAAGSPAPRATMARGARTAASPPFVTPPSTASHSPWRATAAGGYAVATGGRQVPYARAVPAPVSRAAPATSSGWWPAPLDNVVGKTSVIILAATVVFVIANIAAGERSLLRAPLRSQAALAAAPPPTATGTRVTPTTAAPVIPPARRARTGQSAPTRVPIAPGSDRAPSLAMTRLPAEGATPTAYAELAERSTARALRESASNNAMPMATPAAGAPTSGAPPSGASAPGVPSITRNALPIRDEEAARIRRVNPATRPTPRAAPSPARVAAPGLDQLRLVSGRTVMGRVDIIRTASVVFREAETGLRYEFAKDDIDEIITEFGNPVRFRRVGGAPPKSARDRRRASMAGRYAVRYESARINGAPVCRDLWRGPSGADVATVRHRPGDDTLSVAFDGGDTFPSVLDADGFFSSTFRILPGQAELATALTTRLNGRFNPDGSLTMQVNVIGYRRVQGTNGVACHIIVDATGERTR